MECSILNGLETMYFGLDQQTKLYALISFSSKYEACNFRVLVLSDVTYDIMYHTQVAYLITT